MKLIETNINADDPAFLYLNLHPGESIIFVIRHHWAGFLGTLGLIVLMGTVPAVLFALAGNVASGFIPNAGSTVGLFAVGYYLLLITILFGSWINYYYDIVFVTSERIINVAQEGLLSRQTSELSLRQVENVTATVDGFIQSAFDYGLLVVETAGANTGGDAAHQGYFTIIDVPDPNRIARTILELHRELDLERDEAHA